MLKIEYIQFSEVVKLIKLLILILATNAMSERFVSARQHIKTYLRSTMSQQYLNHCVILQFHVHKEATDSRMILLMTLSTMKTVEVFMDNLQGKTE